MLYAFKHLKQKSAELLDVGKVVRVCFFQLLNGGHFDQHYLASLSAFVFFLCPDIGRVGFLVFAYCIIGVPFSFMRFVRYGATVAIPTLAAALLGLWASLLLF